MNLALTREAIYRFRAQPVRLVAVQRDYADLVAKLVILVLFSSMAMRLAENAAQTGHVTGILLVASEALVVALTLVRRSAGTVDRSWRARILTFVATFGAPLVRPTASPLAPETLTIIIASCGLMIVVLGKLSLGRSFGLAPANRGIVSTGLYRVVRHPIYLGYLVTHIGFVIANPGVWNWSILAIADVALLLRAKCEERTLALDPEYRAYMQRVHWRIVPKIF
jgi:protein-S-isoprenylcysteine O-methyltransferase Ste14